MRASLETLFLRFRDHADLKALAQVFDRTARDLLNVAYHLVHDAHDAEDVLQQTFAAAIERAASFDARKSLVPWLTGILARQAAELRRRSARVVEPDRLDERRSAPDPSARTVEAELTGSVRAALAQVPELYRGVLVPLLEDGKRPEEIARELGRAPGTVRMQIHRGLDLLRRALPAGISAALLGTLTPRGLAAVRQAVLDHAASAAAVGAASVAAAGAGSGVGSSLLAGGWFVSKNAWLAGVGVALATSTAWLWWGADAEGLAATGGPSERAHEDVVRLEGPVIELAAGATAPAAHAADPAPGDRVAATVPGVWLVGNVFGPLPEHASDVRVHVSLLDDNARPQDALAQGSRQPWAQDGDRYRTLTRIAEVPDGVDAIAQIDLASPLLSALSRGEGCVRSTGSSGAPSGQLTPDGRIELELTGLVDALGGWEEFLAANLRVRLDHELYMPLAEALAVVDLTRASRFEDGAERIELRVDLELQPAAVLRGRVASEDGFPLVNRMGLTDSFVQGFETAELEEGSYTLRASLLDVDGDVLDATSASIVFLLSPSLVRPRRAVLFELLGGQLGERPVAEVDLDFDDTFEFKVPAGGLFALAVIDADRRPISRIVELELRAVVELEEALAFPETFALAGFVDDHGLAAGQGIEVHAERVLGPHDQARSCAEVEVVFDGLGFELRHHRITSEADGRFEFERLAAGLYRLDAGGLTGAVALYEPRDEERVLVSAPGAGVAVELRGARVELELTIDGRPPTEDECTQFALMLRRARDGAQTGLHPALDAKGRVTVLVEPNGEYALDADGPAILRGSSSFEAPEQGRRLEVALELESRP